MCVSGQRLFSDLFESRLIAQTPWLDVNSGEDQYQRYREIQSYLKTSGFEYVSWLALDDNLNAFPNGSPGYITNSETGLNSDDADRIIDAYSVRKRFDS